MIPRRPEEISTAFVTRALRESGALPEGRVRALERIPDSRPQGYNGKLVRFRLVLDREVPEAPETIAAKFPPDDQTMVTQMGSLVGELRFYTELAESTPVLTPRCFFGGLETAPGKQPGDAGFALPDSTPAPILRVLLSLGRRTAKKTSRRFLLLLEDLSDKRFGDPHAGCGGEEGAEIIRTLAALHARYWDDHSLDRERWIPRALSFPQFIESQFNRWLEDRMEAMERDGDPKLKGIVLWLRSNARAVVQRLAAFPQTLLHGDPHLDNVYFSNGNVGLVDWQTIQKGVGVLDVTRFMLGSLDGASDVEEDLIRVYHTELVSRGILDFSFDHCLQAYQLSKIYFLLVGALGQDQVGERGRRFDELHAVGKERFHEALPENYEDLLRP